MAPCFLWTPAPPTVLFLTHPISHPLDLSSRRPTNNGFHAGVGSKFPCTSVAATTHGFSSLLPGLQHSRGGFLASFSTDCGRDGQTTATPPWPHHHRCSWWLFTHLLYNRPHGSPCFWASWGGWRKGALPRRWLGLLGRLFTWIYKRRHFSTPSRMS